MSQPLQTDRGRCPVSDSLSPELHPPRWAPAFLRWQHTEIGWLKSWWLALRGSGRDTDTPSTSTPPNCPVRTTSSWRVRRWPNSSWYAIAEMNYVTMDIIARTMFGIDLSGELAERMRADFARLLTLFGYGFIIGVSRPLRWSTDRLRRHGPRGLARRSPRLASPSYSWRE
jgi:hypothetical protein